MEDFWQRLKRHRLMQWALAYIAGAWVLLQVLGLAADSYHWPDILMQSAFAALGLGLVVALVLGWYHGERGAQRIGGMEIMILALLLAIGGWAIWHFGPAANGSRVAASGLATAAAPHAAKTTDLPVAVTARIPEKSVAVLPFANEGGRPDEQFFSDGLSEDLINTLSQFAGLKVISRNSAFQFRDSKDSAATIGAKLGVAHLLEGSVRRQDDQVRISTELVNAADGTILWSQHYDRPYQDLFALQDAITQAVADALEAKLLTAPGVVVQSDRPPSGNLAAYTAYLRGIDDDNLNTEQGIRNAIATYGEAIRLDPKYASAYARSSVAWMRLAIRYLGGAQAQQAYALAHTASDTALVLDPDSALAHLARAGLLQTASMDWAGAEVEVRRALQLAPNDAIVKSQLGNILAALGHAGRAAEMTRQALAADPRHARWYNWEAVQLAALGRLDEAAQAAQTALALQPGADGYAEQLTIVEILRGDAKAALAAAQEEPPGVWHDVAMALALQIGPDHAAADAALKKMIVGMADVAAYQIAQVYALRKDPEGMFKWLDRAWTNRDPGINYLLADPLILRYRNDPRFAAFCKKVGLPTTTDAVAMK